VHVSDFNYDLPPELVAQKPLPERDESRMMVVRRKEGKILHAQFKDFPDHLQKGDVLVLNNTKVIPAKVWGKRGGASVEFLFIKEKAPGFWDVLCKPAKRVRPGDKVFFPDGLEAEVVGTGDEGRRTLRFPVTDILGHLRNIGFAPLPPYVKRKKGDTGERPKDLNRYQTVFAEKDGAIAAPTAGLHFTEDILQTIEDKGVRLACVTLDVGLATFQPMRVERIEDHKMLEETYSISEGAAAAINQAKKDERPVVAVGTTVVRSLESAAANVQRSKKEERSAVAVKKELMNFIQSGRATTSLFIHPGYEFKVVDKLLTNFHLPKSTLLVLVAAFAGRDLIMEAYREAVREKYRFFSYGDCMLII
jgi:S-adenosylmethionine:tRNA ribosyltransferase-isomerase